MARINTNRSAARAARFPHAVPSARRPVIILGMHRSGTSMISELLEQLGLFVGDTLQDDHESTFFLDLNDQLLGRVNAAWDHPLPFRDFLATPAAVEMTAAALATDMTSRRAARFFNARAMLSSKSFESFDRPWGWKDPRTVFTLPVWLHLFPGAKLVYIIRHGVDVAASLSVREQKLLKHRQERFAKKLSQRSSRSALDRAGYKGSVRCLSLEGAFGLWTEYVQQAAEVLSDIDEPVLTLRYEDFLAEPSTHLRKLATFCELPDLSDAAISRGVAKVKPMRANAFLTDPTLAEFYGSVMNNHWMSTYRYGINGRSSR